MNTAVEITARIGLIVMGLVFCPGVAWTVSVAAADGGAMRQAARAFAVPVEPAFGVSPPSALQSLSQKGKRA